MIWYLCPGHPDTLSGGTRKLYDHVAILQSRGIAAELIYTHQVGAIPFDQAHDLIVVPEVYGDGLRDFIPRGWRRISFVQNSYLLDQADGTRYVADPDRHPLVTTPELVAIFTESDHTTRRIAERFGDQLTVPLIRTRSSGNGRRGETAGFTYGPWPRERRVVFFQYKHEQINREVFDGLILPEGWDIRCMTGLTDEQIAAEYRTAAIFVAANTNEGMCAPTSEAIISGCVIVCWTGGGPDEYLVDNGGPRAVIAPQDDVPALRDAIVDTCVDIDVHPGRWANRTRDWSDWFQANYSREQEIDEIVTIFEWLS